MVDWNSPSIVNGMKENMEQMIAFWEELEMVENTPVVEQFTTRRRESSIKLDKLLNIFGENLKEIILCMVRHTQFSYYKHETGLVGI